MKVTEEQQAQIRARITKERDRRMAQLAILADLVRLGEDYMEAYAIGVLVRTAMRIAVIEELEDLLRPSREH